MYIVMQAKRRAKHRLHRHPSLEKFGCLQKLRISLTQSINSEVVLPYKEAQFTLVHSKNTGGKPELLWLYRYICSSTNVTNNSTVLGFIGPFLFWDTGMLTSCQAATAPLYMYQYAELVYSKCLHIHLPCHSLHRWSSRQTWVRVAPVVLAVQSSACSCKSHTWACKYMEHFRAYTDLGNQGATNAG